ncbi:hypothetical protein VSU19_00820 [Verrucomicrobiales bacterium BCK34]|nr:hypothetical protein [Verrucomicrobiales bacterium BCK34]
MESKSHEYLRRLDSSFYMGNATVHWSHTIDQRRTGWLTSDFHSRFRELLLHVGYTYHVWTLAYSLMPDHFHILWFGVDESSDQKLATTWLRREANKALKSAGDSQTRLQKQPYDHVLRPQETDRFSIEKVASYLWENPTRAGLSFSNSSGPFIGSVIPGSTRLSWHGEIVPPYFWEKFWSHRSRAIASQEKRT